MFKDTNRSITLNPYFKETTDSKLVVWSHDKNSFKMNMELTSKSCPMLLSGGTPRIVLQFKPKNEIGIYPLVVESAYQGLVSFVVPEQILGFVGEVYAFVYVDFEEQTYDFGSFKFSMEKSAIDGDFKELDELYVKEFSEAVENIKKIAEEYESKYETLIENSEKEFNDLIANWKEIGDLNELVTKEELNNLPEIVEARKDLFGDSHTSLTERVKVSELLFKARQTQSTSVGDVIRNLKMGSVGILIALAGDSLTYGYDTQSSDRRPADPIPTDDGTAHARERASVTYPEKLQEYFDMMYGSKTIITRNMGYSGVTTKTYFERWHASKSNLFILMLGTNDSTKQSVEDYAYWLRRIILREYENNTPVLFVLPPKKKVTADPNLASYRKVMIQVANENNIPFLDLSKNQESINQNLYSDTTHFNGLGYTYIATKVFSFLNGESMLNKVEIYSTASLGLRNQLDGYTSIGGVGWLTEENVYPTPSEVTSGVGVAAYLQPNREEEGVYWCFETKEDNMVVFPSFYYHRSNTEGANLGLKMELDFGIEQAAMQNSLAVHNSDMSLPVSTHYTPDSHVVIEKEDLNYPDKIIGNSQTPNGKLMKNWAYISSIKSLDDKFIIISKKGHHTVRLSRINGSNGNVNLFSLDFVNLEILKGRVALNTPQKYQFKVANHYTNTEDIIKTELILSDVMSKLKIDIQMSTYGENPPLKVTLFSYDQVAVIYYLQIGKFSNGTYFLLSNPEIRRFGAYEGEDYRSLKNVTTEIDNDNVYNSKIIFNYEGNLKHQTIVTIELG